MKKRSKTGASEMLLDADENAQVDLEALQRERERLLKALEKIRSEKQRIRKKTNRLLSKAKRLNCILARSHPEPEYLMRDE